MSVLAIVLFLFFLPIAVLLGRIFWGLAFQRPCDFVVLAPHMVSPLRPTPPHPLDTFWSREDIHDLTLLAAWESSASPRAPQKNF